MPHKDPEAAKACHRAYYVANSTELKAKQKRYREANPEKVAERKRRYREANAEKVAAKDRRYRTANKEKIAAKDQRFRSIYGILYEVCLRSFDSLSRSCPVVASPGLHTNVRVVGERLASSDLN